MKFSIVLRQGSQHPTQHLVVSALAAVVGLAMTGSGPAMADVLYDNLGATNASVQGDGVSSTGTFTNTVPFGPLSDSFSTGSSPFVFKYLDLRLDRPDAPSGSITVSLLNDSSTSPGTLNTTLGTVADSAVTTSAEIVEISVASINLLANTRYWIQLSSSDGSDISWEYSFDNSGVGVAGEFFDNQDGVASNSFGPYQMRIADTSLPEPATLAIFGLGLAGLGFMRHRRAA